MTPFATTVRIKGGLVHPSQHSQTSQDISDARYSLSYRTDNSLMNSAPNVVTEDSIPIAENSGMGITTGTAITNSTIQGAFISTAVTINKKIFNAQMPDLSAKNNDSYFPPLRTDNIRCIQHNLERSLIPTQELCVLMDSSRADLALVQEPYTGNSSSIRGFPSSASKFYSDTGLQPVSAIILRNNQLQMRMDKQLSNGNITVTTICARSFSIALVNVYFPPRDPDFSTHLEKLSAILLKYPNTIIAGDFNCRHPSWGDRIANPNGEMLYDFIESNDLSISNNFVTFSTRKKATGMFKPR